MSYTIPVYNILSFCWHWQVIKKGLLQQRGQVQCRRISHECPDVSSCPLTAVLPPNSCCKICPQSQGKYTAANTNTDYTVDKLTNRACCRVSHNALFWIFQAFSVNDSIISDFDWVCLGILVISCIVGMLFTCLTSVCPAYDWSGGILTECPIRGKTTSLVQVERLYSMVYTLTAASNATMKCIIISKNEW